MISTVINNVILIQEKQKISSRSFKNLDIVALNEDIANIDLPLHKDHNIIQLMTFDKVDTSIYQPKGSDIH